MSGFDDFVREPSLGDTPPVARVEGVPGGTHDGMRGDALAAVDLGGIKWVVVRWDADDELVPNLLMVSELRLSREVMQ